MADRDSLSYKPGEYFRRYQLQNLAPNYPNSEEDVDESEGDIESTSKIIANDNSVEKVDNEQASQPKRKATSTQGANPKAKKQKINNKKFTWTPEKIEDLLAYVKEYKSNCDFKGIDFEADLSSFYTEVRKCMARKWSTEFGPENVTEPEMEIKDMDKDTYQNYTKKTNAEKLLIKSGYSRVKEKIKTVRQDYRTAVNKGTRSGSSRVVQENYDLLSEIWGGSPATTSLTFGVDGDSILVYQENDNQADSPSSNDNSFPSADSPSSSATDDSPSTETASHSKIPKLVDNKRKHMEKRLSQVQRDQILLNNAKEDMQMKKNMLEIFEKSNKTLEESITKMTTSISSLGDGIAAGMQMLAMALTQNQQAAPPPPQSYYPGQYMGYQNQYGTNINQ